MARTRLDQALVDSGLVKTRSQAESYIKLGKVRVNDEIVQKPSMSVGPEHKLAISQGIQYVSRAALKLESVAEAFNLNFKDKVVLDVGSSTGGFTDFALRGGAKKVIAVDIGKQQLHISLRQDQRVELLEKTDIRSLVTLSSTVDIVLIDVSFISLREILPGLIGLVGRNVDIFAMVKPQFEAGAGKTNKGIIKNDTVRREILKDFEKWSKNFFSLKSKADSSVAGSKGNKERFYWLRPL